MGERAAPGTADEIVQRWIEANLGVVSRIERQPRWRPVWFVTLADGREMLVRGDRVDMELIFPLDHERRFQEVLHASGIPVPAVHGWIEELPAFVMDAVPGEAYLAGADEIDRRTVMREYLDALAELHRLPLDRFVAAGIVRAGIPEYSGRVGMARYEERYRRAKRRPDPLLEFALAWLRRHPPDSRGREAPIVWDSGQFHHHRGHLVALLDLELGHVGDPMMDLAAFRMRDTIGGFGDFGELYALYEAAAGSPVDIEAIKIHHVAFTLTNRLAFSAALRNPPPGSDLMTNLQWCRETDLFTTEALAELVGVDLPTIDPPEPVETRATPAFTQLVRILGTVDVADPYLRYELRTAFRLARHAQRCDEIAETFDQHDLDDLVSLLGNRPATWDEGEAELEHFVLADDGAHDEVLIEVFHKRNLRAHALLGPAGSAMTTHRRIQGFG